MRLEKADNKGNASLVSNTELENGSFDSID